MLDTIYIFTLIFFVPACIMSLVALIKKNIKIQVLSHIPWALFSFSQMLIEYYRPDRGWFIVWTALLILHLLGLTRFKVAFPSKTK